MTPVDEKKEREITKTHVKTEFKLKNYIASSKDDLMNYIPNIEIKYTKSRNKMKHLTPKKKKRK